MGICCCAQFQFNKPASRPHRRYGRVVPGVVSLPGLVDALGEELTNVLAPVRTIFKINLTNLIKKYGKLRGESKIYLDFCWCNTSLRSKFSAYCVDSVRG